MSKPPKEPKIPKMTRKDREALEKSGKVPDNGAVVEYKQQLIKGAKVKSDHGTYKVVRRLGKGGFGEVLKVHHVESNKLFAMKIEKLNCPQMNQQLKVEANVLNILNKHRSHHFTGLTDYGIGKNFRYIIIPLVGRSIESLRKKYLYQQFTTRTALYLMENTLEALMELHDLGFIHRDIKPGNFAVDLLSQTTVIMLDFGCARYIRDPWGHMLLPRMFRGFIGTEHFASRNMCINRDIGRNDDVESWFYMAVDLWNEDNLRTINGFADPEKLSSKEKDKKNKGKPMDTDLNELGLHKHKFLLEPESRPSFWHPIAPLSYLEIPDDENDPLAKTPATKAESIQSNLKPAEPKPSRGKLLLGPATNGPPRKAAGRARDDDDDSWKGDRDAAVSRQGGMTQATGVGGATTINGMTTVHQGGETTAAYIDEKENLMPIKRIKVMPNAFLEIICEINRTQPLCRPNYEDIIDAIRAVPRESHFSGVDMCAPLDWLNKEILCKAAKAKAGYEERREERRKKLKATEEDDEQFVKG